MSGLVGNGVLICRTPYSHDDVANSRHFRHAAFHRWNDEAPCVT
uniref:Uncharacterized protein n=1 Tax=Magnetospirillum gryphiswaldense TaxID=55518 RepID=A4TV83_9PROT|nr:hypothetical protein MGR_0956 [Magnetospirillum gryphiswaldense MSR-1]